MIFSPVRRVVFLIRRSPLLDGLNTDSPFIQSFCRDYDEAWTEINDFLQQRRVPASAHPQVETAISLTVSAISACLAAVAVSILLLQKKYEGKPLPQEHTTNLMGCLSHIERLDIKEISALSPPLLSAILMRSQNLFVRLSRLLDAV